MKTKQFTLLISFILIATVGCTKRDLEDRAPKMANEIKIEGSLDENQYPIHEELPQNKTLVNLDVYCIRAEDGLEPNWQTNYKIISGNLTGIREEHTKGEIEFDERQFYNTDPEMKSWMIFYHPALNIDEHQFFWDINGYSDIIYSKVTTGDKNCVVVTTTLQHQLSWLSFSVATDNAEEANNYWGKITQIDVIETPTKALFTLPDEVKFTQIGSVPSYLNATETTGLQSITTEKQFFSSSLVVPGKLIDEHNYTLRVYTTKRPDGSDVNIKLVNNTDAVGGTKYDVALSFIGTGIEVKATASISDWKQGDAIGILVPGDN